MKFRDLAKKAKQAAQDGFQKIADSKPAGAAVQALDGALEKTGLKNIFHRAKEKLPLEAAEKQWQALSGKLETLGVNDAARELQKAFTGLTPDDAAGILRHTYKNMSTDEAIKIGGAILAPGGIPVYVVMKLVEYKQQQEKEQQQEKNKNPEPPSPAT